MMLAGLTFKFIIMEILKETIILVLGVGIGVYLLRLLWKVFSRKDKYDKAGVVHTPILLDSMPIEDETIQAFLDYALKLEGDRKVGKTYKNSQSGTYSEPIKKATSNDGFIWTESDTISNDAIDGLYHTSHDIDHTPSFGNGGDFGGGGASGSWDSGSSSDSGSYDSGSSDSSSSWSD